MSQRASLESGTSPSPLRVNNTYNSRVRTQKHALLTLAKLTLPSQIKSSAAAVHLMRVLADEHSAGSSARARLRAVPEGEPRDFPNHISKLAALAKDKLSLEIEYGSPHFSLPEFDSLESSPYAASTNATINGSSTPLPAFFYGIWGKSPSPSSLCLH